MASKLNQTQIKQISDIVLVIREHTGSDEELGNKILTLMPTASFPMEVMEPLIENALDGFDPKSYFSKFKASEGRLTPGHIAAADEKVNAAIVQAKERVRAQIQAGMLALTALAGLASGGGASTALPAIIGIVKQLPAIFKK